MKKIALISAVTLMTAISAHATDLSVSNWAITTGYSIAANRDAAQNICESSNLDGYSWRLPTSTEINEYLNHPDMNDSKLNPPYLLLMSVPYNVSLGYTETSGFYFNKAKGSGGVISFNSSASAVLCTHS
ncbi:TPA: hypothetical protein ACX6SR_000438 [Photobacterium damselae]